MVVIHNEKKSTEVSGFVPHDNKQIETLTLKNDSIKRNFDVKNSEEQD
jgi:hypothetical protein